MQNFHIHIIKGHDDSKIPVIRVGTNHPDNLKEAQFRIIRNITYLDNETYVCIPIQFRVFITDHNYNNIRDGLIQLFLAYQMSFPEDPLSNPQNFLNIKGYRLCEMPPDEKKSEKSRLRDRFLSIVQTVMTLQSGAIYVDVGKKGNSLDYLVLDPNGKPVKGTITRQAFGRHIPKTLETLKPFLPKILEITAERGDTSSIIDDYKTLRKTVTAIGKQYFHAILEDKDSKELEQIRGKESLKSAEYQFWNSIKKVFNPINQLILESKPSTTAGVILQTLFWIFDEEKSPEHNWKTTYNGTFIALIHLLVHFINQKGGFSIVASGGCKSADDRWQKLALLIKELCLLVTDDHTLNRKSLLAAIAQLLTRYASDLPFNLSCEHSALGKSLYPKTKAYQLNDPFPAFGDLDTTPRRIISPSDMKLQLFIKTDSKDDPTTSYYNYIPDTSPEVQLNQLISRTIQPGDDKLGSQTGLMGSFAQGAVGFCSLLGKATTGENRPLQNVISMNYLSDFPAEDAKAQEFFTTKTAKIGEYLNLKKFPSEKKEDSIFENSGAMLTWVVLDLQKRRISVGHLGDCTVHLLTHYRDESFFQPHRLDNPKEIKRLAEAGFEIKTIDGIPKITQPDIPENEWLDISGAFGLNRFRGLQSTLQTTTSLLPDQGYLLIATHNLTEKFPPNEIRDVLKKKVYLHRAVIPQRSPRDPGICEPTGSRGQH